MHPHADRRPTATPSFAPPQITATAVTASSIHQFVVDDLSVNGACLRGVSSLPRRRLFDIIVRVPFYPPIRVRARVVNNQGTATNVRFVHEFDFTEDQIQAALLSELERRQALN